MVMKPTLPTPTSSLRSIGAARNRRCAEHRVPLDVPVSFLDEAGNRGCGRATDLSVGGIRIETDAATPFGCVVIVKLRLPGCPRELTLPAVVRWTHGGAMGLQFGLIGARETHLITERATGSRPLEAEDVAWIG